MTVSKKKCKLFVSIAILFIVFVLWVIWGNKALELNIMTVSSDTLPESFDGYRIAHVSDFHNTEIGEDNVKLLDMLKSAKPDMIAITGDLVDSRRTNIDIALEFVEQAVKIAPCYYVTGNHEARIADYYELKTGLEAAGVIVLENECVKLEIDNESITLIGIEDPNFSTDYLFEDSEIVVGYVLNELVTEDNSYKILLSHRPELFDTYVESNVNLVLSGHAHGGQFRLPFVGGVIAPNQGFFPEYDAGLYEEGKTNMIVSRGIGNSLFPFRINNRPEVVLVVLENKGRFKE